MGSGEFMAKIATTEIQNDLVVLFLDKIAENLKERYGVADGNINLEQIQFVTMLVTTKIDQSLCTWSHSQEMPCSLYQKALSTYCHN